MDLAAWFINGWALAAVFGAAIIVWAVMEHRRYSQQFEKLGRHVSDAAGVLSSIPTPTDFYHRLRTTALTLESNPAIGRRFREFHSTLLPARGEKPLRSPQPAGEFFNEDLYRTGDINVRAYEALPNQFVGVGLCLTFLGLSISLFFARNIVTATAEKATTELESLLEAASFKFITSLVALVVSVIFVHLKNKRLFNAERQIGEFCEQLDRLIPPVTPEELAEESNEEQRRQGEQLEAANRILATGIANALEDKLKSAMGSAMQPLEAAIHAMTDRLSDINRSALEHMAKRFSETLAGAAKGHTDEMARMLEQSAEAIGSAPAAIRAASVALNDSLSANVSGVSQAIETWSQKFASTSDKVSIEFQKRGQEHAEVLGEALRQEGNSLLENLSMIADELTAAPARLEAAAETFSTATVNATRNVQELLESSGQGLASSMTDAAVSLKSSVSSLDTAVERSAHLLNQLADLSGGIKDQLSAIYKGAEELTSRLSSLASDVSFAGTAAKSLASLATRMEDVTAELSKGIADLGAISTTGHATSLSTHQLIEKLGQRSEAMERELAHLDQALTSSFDKAAAGFEALGDRTAKYMGELDETTAKSLRRFSEALESFGTLVSTFSAYDASAISDYDPASRVAAE